MRVEHIEICIFELKVAGFPFFLIILFKCWKLLLFAFLNGLFLIKIFIIFSKILDSIES